MNPILFLAQIGIEGPGRLADVLEACGVPMQICKLYAGDPLPGDPTAFSAIVPLGGPMNVYEEDKHPFLADEDRLLKQALKADVPILGVCLGAQLLAKAAGARVVRNPVPEVGWMEVELNADGKRDALFTDLGGALPVFQWHGDTFELPAGATHLASSPYCANQAFRIGRAAYGLQFHVEVTPEMVSEWTDAYLEDLRRHDDGAIERHLRRDAPKHDSRLAAMTERMFGNFLNLIGNHG